MLRALAILALLVAAPTTLGCEGLVVAPKQEGEACTRTNQCAPPLMCIGGQCAVPLDASIDAAADAATDAPSGG